MKTFEFTVCAAGCLPDSDFYPYRMDFDENADKWEVLEIISEELSKWEGTETDTNSPLLSDVVDDINRLWYGTTDWISYEVAGTYSFSVQAV